MNKVSNETGARYVRTAIRHGRHPRHQYRLHRLHRLSHGIGDGQDVRCRGRNRRAVHELHKALADVARTGDKQLRGEAAQIVAEATSRLNGLLATDRGHLA